MACEQRPGREGKSWKHVFGPALSRRLGMSLGIDPIKEKTCNWNCVYCQLGRTAPLRSEREEFISTKEILAEAREALSSYHPGNLDWVTFVGSGEPLLHARFGELLRGVKGFTCVPVAVITNGALLSRAEIRKELEVADAVLPTLDVGTPARFRRVNRPHPGITFHEHVSGLKAFRQEFQGRLFLEVMLIKGLNDSEDALRELAGWIEEIRPHEVHISLPERPPAESWVAPTDSEGLMRASTILGSVTRVLSPGESVLVLDDMGTALSTLLGVLGRHPLRENQIISALASLATEDKNRILKSLEDSGQVKRVRRHGCVFWVSVSARFPEDEKNYIGTRK